MDADTRIGNAMADVQTQKIYSPFYYGIAGLCSIFIGIGLCRLAYTPLIPAFIHHHWLTTTGASDIGAINFIGYFLGTCIVYRSTKHIHPPTLIKLSFILSVISLALPGFNLGAAWLAVWRFMAGATGAFLVILTPKCILKNVPEQHRAHVSGATFTGMGIGTLLSTLLFPAIAKSSMLFAWLGISALALIAAVIAWPAFQNYHQENIAAKPTPSSPNQTTLKYINIGYALFATGTVPSALLLVDYLHVNLHFSLVASGLFYSLFAIGSLIGPYLLSHISQKAGLYKTLTISLVMAVTGNSIMIHNQVVALFGIGAFIMGVLVISVVALTSLRVLELTNTEEHPYFWGNATLYFAIGQAAGGCLMSIILRTTHNYSDCFLAGSIAFVLSLICYVFANNKANEHI